MPCLIRHFPGRFFMAALLLLSSQVAYTETVNVPLQIDFQLLRQLIVSQLFRDEADSTELLHDPSGCSEILLSNPQLGEESGHLQINARLNAKLAVKMLNQCMPLLRWEGYAQIIADPVIRKDDPRVLYLQVVDSHLINLDQERLTSGALWDQARKHIHPLFNRFRLDLNSSISELQTFLPTFLPRHSHAQLDAMLASLHLADVQVETDGIRGELAFEIESADLPPQKEQALTEREQQEWQQKWQSMDALLTFAIKHYAAATELEELRQTLFDILLDSRYRLQDALRQDHTDDPVRHWFVDSWTQLIPVLKQISAENPRHATLGLMTLITASDALQTLDKLGPTFGLDISIDGLRRLARLMNSSPDIDPLKFDEDLDPELMRLFRFNLDIDDRSQPTLNFWPIRSAVAADKTLSHWLPDNQHLDAYLSRTHRLLSDTADRTLAKAALPAQQQEVFRKLVLTTAWQESCWRQYVVERNKIVPLRSASGDTGIMQVNENVWRGFADIHKLRWDIAYNVQTGSRILLNYMTRYAVKKGEHKLNGGLDNLARATYSAYNGGPGQISRYRNSKAAKPHREIDQAFHKKYRTVKQGNELAVARCLGGEEIKVAAAPPSPKQKPPTRPAKQAPVPATTKQTIFNEKWISRQAKNHYTLQLGVFSSHQAATAFIQQQPISGYYAVYRQPKNSQTQYTVIYGRYAKRQLAEKDSLRFKPVKPWIRTFHDIRTIMNL